jgi:hydrogenase maturation protein HypF
MGRLFDAVASLIGVRHEVNYEAQAAVEMESLAVKGSHPAQGSVYRFEVRRPAEMPEIIGGSLQAGEPTCAGPPLEIHYKELLSAICRDVQCGVLPAVISAQFHQTVAEMAVSVCRLARRQTGIRTVGLSGGVFQNVLLLELVHEGLRQAGFEVLTHQIVPPNDGGLALGQAVAARNRMA